MTKLNSEARRVLADAGITVRDWITYGGWLTDVTDEAGNREWIPETEWRGDECGCTDDRCIGHHHDENEECGCLPALIEEHRKQERASVAGRAVWAAHLRAADSGTTEDRAAADELAAAWISEYYTGAVSHSLTESPRGITYRNQWNDTTWLIFDAERSQVTAEALHPTA